MTILSMILPGELSAAALKDRSVSAAPSRLEIRGFVVTEHEPPLNLIPVAT